MNQYAQLLSMRVFGILLLYGAAGPASALLIDFEDIAQPSGTVTNGSPDQISRGFLFDSQFDHFHIGNDPTDGSLSWNGTTWLGADWFTPYLVTMSSGSVFSLNQLDIGELNLTNGLATTIQVTGNYDGGGSISTDIIMDLVADGPGSLVDFQTVLFDSTWSNLSSVTFFTTEGSGDYGFVLDDIIVNNQPNPVPIPAAVWLFGTALIGLVGFGKRRKAA